MSLLLSFGRDLWAAIGGHCAVREEVWAAVSPTAGGTVCGFYSGARTYRGGTLSDAWASQPCQRFAGFFWLWREATLWQVSWHQKFRLFYLWHVKSGRSSLTAAILITHCLHSESSWAFLLHGFECWGLHLVQCLSRERNWAEYKHILKANARCGYSLLSSWWDLTIKIHRTVVSYFF